MSNPTETPEERAGRHKREDDRRARAYAERMLAYRERIAAEKKGRER